MASGQWLYVNKKAVYTAEWGLGSQAKQKLKYEAHRFGELVPISDGLELTLEESVIRAVLRNNGRDREMVPSGDYFLGN